MVHTGYIELSTHGHCDVIDVSPHVQRIVEESRIPNGIVCVANPGSTAAITTVECEPGAVADLCAALEQLAPQNRRYRHNDTWDDGNGCAHLRSALIGASRVFPVLEGRVLLGTWQQVVFLDFDNRPRQRRLVVTVVGETKESHV